MSELVLSSAGRSLACRVFHPAGRDPSGAAILFIHGLGSDQRGYAPRAEAAADALGATCLTFDLAGHGRSEGSLEELAPREHFGDALVAFDALTELDGVDPGRVGVCAASYGAFLAVLLTSSRHPRSLLLRAPGLYSDEQLDRPRGHRSSGVETPATAVALRDLAAYDGPVLILESERDELIPHTVIEAYLSACLQGRHKVLKGAGHHLGDERLRSLFVDLIVDWFGQTLPA